jgi:hypothetical protein
LDLALRLKDLSKDLLKKVREATDALNEALKKCGCQ